MSEKFERRTQAERKATTRALIEQATVTVVARVGFEGLTIDAVARTSGASRGATSFHFPHRESLVAPVLAHTIAALNADARTAFASAPGVGPSRIRAALGSLLLARFRDDPAVKAWPEVLRRSARDPSTRILLLPQLVELERFIGEAVADSAEAAGMTLRFERSQIGALLLGLCESTLERVAISGGVVTDADQRAFGTIGIAMTTS